jgi:DNA-directed RNA polymerase specialized sigma24 family protein
MKFFRDQAERLSAEEQQVFRSIYIEGHPPAIAAAALGVPLGRVDELNVAVLRKLREA